jgi:excisionase family DNA binding protein
LPPIGVAQATRTDKQNPLVPIPIVASVYNYRMLLTVYEVAERFNISPEWVWRKVREEVLPHYRFGRYSIRLDLAEVEAYMRDHHRPLAQHGR